MGSRIRARRTWRAEVSTDERETWDEVQVIEAHRIEDWSLNSLQAQQQVLPAPGQWLEVQLRGSTAKGT